MNVKIKYKAIDLRGNNVSFTHTHICPDYEEIDTEFIIGDKVHQFKTSIDEQVMDWLDNHDKMYLIYEHDVHIIVDYSIVHPKPRNKKTKEIKKQEEFILISDTLCDMGLDDEMKINFFITYDRLKDSIDKLSTYEKITIIFKALGLALDAKSAAFQHMIDIFEGDNNNKQLD